MKELIERQPALTKSSTEIEIKTYFKKVLSLKQSGEEFPVNLELVWPLAYLRKEEAVRALRSVFINNVDYQALRRNAERGAASPVDYRLSVPCMEFFIARKVRPVFEVYRQVFHNAAEQAKPLTAAEQLLENARLLVEQERRLADHDNRIAQLEAKAQTRPSYFTVAGYASLHHTPLNLRQAAHIGKCATELCKLFGFPIDRTPDPRFGEVNMYPEEILFDVFERHLVKN